MGLTSGEFNISELLEKFENHLGFQTKIKWGMLLTICCYHALGLYWSYLYAFPAKWQTLLFAFVMYFYTGTGIASGVHRLWTHKSFKAKLPLRIYLMLAFASTGQNSIYAWVRDHRVHHKFSDTAADPHDASRGFWFSHIGWLCMKKNSLVIEKGRQIDMSDIESDPVAMFEKKYSGWLSLNFCFILPTLTGILLWGESWKCAVAWQCFIRFLAIFHAEMSVNSFAHMYGYKPYNKNIKPTENRFVSLVTTGDGAHNYHHTFPFDYRSAEICEFINYSAYFIQLCAMMGLAYDLKRPNPELVRNMCKNQKLETEKKTIILLSNQIKSHHNIL